MIALAEAGFMTPAEYLAWEAEQPVRYEYINGNVYAMAGGTLPHNDIAINLTTALKNFLRGTGCKVRMADAKVEISEQGPYFYPDIVVSCDERDRRAIEAVAYPKLIVEVLSPSTAGFDRGEKFKLFRRIPTLQEYVLIEATKVGIDCYRKGSLGKWELTSYPEDGMEGDVHLDRVVLDLVSLGFSCPLAVVYEDVQLSL